MYSEDDTNWYRWRLFTSLLLAPGERADILIDFTKIKGEFLLTNNANGAPPDVNMRQIMKIIFEDVPGPRKFCINTPDTFKPLNPDKAVNIRFLTLSVEHRAKQELVSCARLVQQIMSMRYI